MSSGLAQRIARASAVAAIRGFPLLNDFFDPSTKLASMLLCMGEQAPSFERIGTITSRIAAKLKAARAEFREAARNGGLTGDDVADATQGIVGQCTQAARFGNKAGSTLRCSRSGAGSVRIARQASGGNFETTRGVRDVAQADVA